MENTWQFINRPTLKYGMCLHKYKDKQCFCGHSILIEGAFVTQLSSIVGISVWWVTWVTTSCCFMSKWWFSIVIQALRIYWSAAWWQHYNHKNVVMLFVSNGMFPQVSTWLLSSQPSQNGAYMGREGDAKSCEDALSRSTCSCSYPVTWACSAYGFYWKGRLACSIT